MVSIAFRFRLVITNSTISPSKKQCLVLMTTRSLTTKKKEPPKLLTTKTEAKRFISDCFLSVGACQEHAEIVSDNLLEADYRGYYSHGMNRLDMYIRDVKAGTCDPNAKCTVEKESVATALANGNHGLGAVVGKFCMDLAIQKAKEVGVGFVAAHASNHYGIATMYTVQAVNQCCIGFSVSNTSPLMVPTGAKQVALGTNPISCAAPGVNGDSFVLDMATSASAVGKIELAKRKGEKIPEGWALNEEGNVETNPEIAMKAMKLMPLSGYKGYGFAMMVEVFSGVIAGSYYGPKIRKWGVSDIPANLGHGFLALYPEFFASGFAERMSDLMNYIRHMTPADPKHPVLVHGDMEKRHMEKVEKDGGLVYVQHQHDTNAKLAKELNVAPMQSSFFCASS